MKCQFCKRNHWWLKVDYRNIKHPVIGLIRSKDKMCKKCADKFSKVK